MDNTRFSCADPREQNLKPKNRKMCDIDVDLLNHLLTHYPSSSKSFLIQGLENGFSIRAGAILQSRFSRNHASALSNPSFIHKKLQKELALDHISGPYDNPPFKIMVCSPIGVVPKKEPGQFRLILDLSYPKGHGINSGIPQEYSSVKYETFDDFVDILLSLPSGALASKADIQHAFRILPIHPSDYHLLGFTWDKQYYFDKRLPMGASSSCATFESLSNAIQWILKQYKVQYVTHILDDFIFLGPPDSETCASGLEFFLLLMQQLGIPINHQKNGKANYTHPGSWYTSRYKNINSFVTTGETSRC